MAMAAMMERGGDFQKISLSKHRLVDEFYTSEKDKICLRFGYITQKKGNCAKYTDNLPHNKGEVIPHYLSRFLLGALLLRFRAAATSAKIDVPPTLNSSGAAGLVSKAALPTSSQYSINNGYC